AMLTVGPDVSNYYRMYIESGNLIVQRKAAGVKAVLFSAAYNGATEKYVRIRHDATSGSVIFEVAGDGGGVPGSWSAVYSESWSSSISMSGVIFEIKAGTWQAEANPPGTVVFDNFKAAIPNQGAGPSLASISPASGGAAGGTSVLISGSGLSSGATVSFGGVAAAGVTVNGSSTITASTPPHASGVVDVVVASSDGSSGALPSAFTYTVNS